MNGILSSSRSSPDTPPPQLRTMDLPAGWLGENEARALAQLAQGRVVLELGSFLGRSTVAMARTAQRVVAVDHHRGSPEHQPGADAGAFVPETRDPNDPSRIDTATQFLKNLGAYGVRDRVTPIIGDAGVVLPLLRPDSFDLAFIDGGHDYPTVLRDLKLAMPLVKSGGWVVCHDAHEPGVWNAIRDISQHAFLSPMNLVGSLVAIFRQS